MSEVPMSLLYRALMYAGSWFCLQLPAHSPHLFGVPADSCTNVDLNNRSLVSGYSDAGRLASLIR